MATYDIVDGFEAQVASATGFAGTGGQPLFNNVTNAVISTADFVHGLACLQCAPTGAAAGTVNRDSTTGVSASAGKSAKFYVKIVASLPGSGTQLTLFRFDGASGAAGIVRYNGTTGRFDVVISGGTATNIGPASVEADRWYLIDVKCVLGSTTHVVTGRVNGDAGTEGAANRTSQTSQNITSIRIGTPSTTGPAATMRYDSVLVTTSDADYPIEGGAVGVFLLKPNADGTHNGGTNIIERNNGTDIGGGTTDAYTLVDEVPIGDTADYIQQVVTGTGNYAEIAFEDPAHTQPLVATVIASIRGAAANAADGIVRIVDSGNSTLVDMGGVGAVSGTTIRYSRKIIPAPGGSWSTEPAGELSGVKARLGFGSDLTPDAHYLGVVIEYAAVVTSEGAATGTIGAVTGSATGTVAVQGSAAQTVAGVVGSASGEASVQGAAVATMPAATGEATGTVAEAGITGTADQTIAPATGSASGTVAVSGAATGTVSPTGTASGSVAVSGAATGSSTPVGAASGSVAVQGAASATMPAATGSASGQTEIRGTAAQTIAAVTGSASGEVLVSGAASATMPAATGLAEGTVVSGASGAATGDMPAATGQASGTISISGAAAAVVTPFGVASGSVEVRGSAAQTIAAILGQASGETTVTGTAASVVPAALGAASGEALVSGTASGTMPAAVGEAFATGGKVGIATATMPAAIGQAFAISPELGIARPAGPPEGDWDRRGLEGRWRARAPVGGGLSG